VLHAMMMMLLDLFFPFLDININHHNHLRVHLKAWIAFMCIIALYMTLKCKCDSFRKLTCKRNSLENIYN